jgi:hypothetical protein
MVWMVLTSTTVYLMIATDLQKWVVKKCRTSGGDKNKSMEVKVNCLVVSERV